MPTAYIMTRTNVHRPNLVCMTLLRGLHKYEQQRLVIRPEDKYVYVTVSEGYLVHGPIMSLTACRTGLIARCKGFLYHVG